MSSRFWTELEMTLLVHKLLLLNVDGREPSGSLLLEVRQYQVEFFSNLLLG